MGPHNCTKYKCMLWILLVVFILDNIILFILEPVPCFPENKIGSCINFLPKNSTRAYFRGISFIFIYQKQNCEVENYEIFKYTKYENRFYLKTAVYTVD